MGRDPNSDDTCVLVQLFLKDEVSRILNSRANKFIQNIIVRHSSLILHLVDEISKGPSAEKHKY